MLLREVAEVPDVALVIVEVHESAGRLGDLVRLHPGHGEARRPAAPARLQADLREVPGDAHADVAP
eukprot:11177282-Alexandrium_andersonii.AAC.1